MADNKIGGLPVVDPAGNLIGIITETDIFKFLLVMLGARTPGVHVERWQCARVRACWPC